METLATVADRWDAVEVYKGQEGPKQRVLELIGNRGFKPTNNEKASAFWMPDRVPHRSYTYVNNSTNFGFGGSRSTVHNHYAAPADSEKGKKKDAEQRAGLLAITGVALMCLVQSIFLRSLGSRYLHDRALYKDLAQEKQKVDAADDLNAQKSREVDQYRGTLKSEISQCQKFVAARLTQDRLGVACGAVAAAFIFAATADVIWKRNIWMYRTWATCLVVLPTLVFFTYMGGPSNKLANDTRNYLNNSNEQRRVTPSVHSSGMGKHITSHEYISNPARHQSSDGSGSHNPSAPSVDDL